LYPFLFQFALRAFFLDFDVLFLGAAIIIISNYLFVNDTLDYFKSQI